MLHRQLISALVLLGVACADSAANDDVTTPEPAAVVADATTDNRPLALRYWPSPPATAVMNPRRFMRSGFGESEFGESEFDESVFDESVFGESGFTRSLLPAS